MNLKAISTKLFCASVLSAHALPLLAGTETITFLGNYEATGDVADVVHLGDQTVDDFVREPTDGTSFTQTFDLPNPLSEGGELIVYIDHYQADPDSGYYDYVYINGASLGYLTNSSSTRWVNQNLVASNDLLVSTGNTLEIRAGAVGSNYDDFEITNVYLTYDSDLEGYVDSASIVDLNGNRHFETVVLKTDSTGGIVVLIKDSSTGEQIGDDIGFFDASWTPVSVAGIKINTGPAISVLATNGETGEAQMQIRNAVTGDLVNTISY